MNRSAKRVQLVLDERTYSELKTQAEIENTSMSHIAREAVSEYVARRGSRPRRGAGSIEGMIGFIKGGPSNASAHVDDIVYGPETSRARDSRRST